MNINKLSKNKFQVRYFLKIWLPTVFWTIVVCYLSLVDSGLPNIKFRFILESDKIAHIGIYLVFNLLLLRSWKNAFSSHSLGNLITFVSLQVVIFSVLMELLQKLLTKHRHFDFKDIYANIAGVTIAVIVFLLFNKYFSKKASDKKA
jgi:hypothetical protein